MKNGTPLQSNNNNTTLPNTTTTTSSDHWLANAGWDVEPDENPVFLPHSIS